MVPWNTSWKLKRVLAGDTTSCTILETAADNLTTASSSVSDQFMLYLRRHKLSPLLKQRTHKPFGTLPRDCKSGTLPNSKEISVQAAADELRLSSTLKPRCFRSPTHRAPSPNLSQGHLRATPALPPHCHLDSPLPDNWIGQAAPR